MTDAIKTISELLEELERARDALDGSEINIQNYTEDEVATLNEASSVAWWSIRYALDAIYALYTIPSKDAKTFANYVVGIPEGHWHTVPSIIQARDIRIRREAFEAGYIQGHNDTVESCVREYKDAAIDYIRADSQELTP